MEACDYDREPFNLNGYDIRPGTVFKKLGEGRTGFDIRTDLIYKGRRDIGHDITEVLFQPRDKQVLLFDYQDKEKWYIVFTLIKAGDETSFLAESRTGFYDVKPSVSDVKTFAGRITNESKM
jgi:hypothetical protein